MGPRNTQDHDLQSRPEQVKSPSGTSRHTPGSFTFDKKYAFRNLSVWLNDTGGLGEENVPRMETGFGYAAVTPAMSTSAHDLEPRATDLNPKHQKKGRTSCEDGEVVEDEM